MADEPIYVPSAWGEEYHSSTIHELLGAGAAGPGKSLVLLMDAVQQITIEAERQVSRDHPFYVRPGESVGWALHLRRTSNMLGQTLVRAQRIFPKIDPGAEWHQKDLMWVFSSGFRYQFGHCAEKGDYMQYDSNQYTWIGFDELVQFTKEQYDFICSRLRTDDPVLINMMKLRSMSNPLVMREANQKFEIDDPYWVRTRFVDPNPSGRIRLFETRFDSEGLPFETDRMYIPATLFDNPNKAYVKAYERELLTKPPHIRAARLYGNWYVTANSFYAELWNETIHVCRPFPIPKDWPHFRSMDWGFKKPGCILWGAIDPQDGTLFVYAEYTFCKKTVRQVAAKQKEKEIAQGFWRGRRSLLRGPADTQLWELRGERVQSKAAEFASYGISWCPADKKSRQRNAELFQARLGDHEKGTISPGIVFFDNCVQCIKTIPAIQTDPTDVEVPQDGGDDHWHDAVLYMVAYLSNDRHGKDETIDESDEEPEKTETPSRGQYGYGSAA